MKPVAILFSAAVVGLLLLLVIKVGEAESPLEAPAKIPAETKIDKSVVRVNAWLRQHWANEGVEPAEMADDLTIYRRLSLGLHGTIPSLEEVNAFRKDSSTDRIERWLNKMLDDSRFADYFAERLERVLVGVEEGQFVIFRRDRLRAWLSEQLRADRPWPEMVTDMIAADGLWTSQPASNFITAAFVDGEGLDENNLAGKTVRAFLGQRIDCAQCHDHPFDTWKQSDFEGLAAFYGQARVTPGGVIDREQEEGEPIEYVITDPGTDEDRVIEPQFPFHSEWATKTGSRRQQLAEWVVHPDNKRFERAIANRVWGLMFGRSWDDPVDDLSHPDDELESREDDDLLDIVGDEFRSNGSSLRFLIRLVAQSDAFRLKSDAPGADNDMYSAMSFNGAVFPLVRLRPEQMIGSMFQAASVRTIDQNSNLFVRFARFANENDFLKEYGDADDDELLQQSGTIPQALLRMNGRFTRELTDTGLFSSAGQLLAQSGDNETLVQNCFLACLSRLPNSVEREYFVRQLKDANQEDEDENARAPLNDDEERPSKNQIVKDMFWVLFNSPGFSWNH